jgi:hypothetical protein
MKPAPELSIIVMAYGLLGGIAAGLNCCCWPASLIAGWAGGRLALRAGHRGAPGIGFGIGFIAALVASTFGTALFLSGVDDTALQAGADAAREVLGDAPGVPSRAAAALGFSVLSFWAQLGLGLLGGLFAGAGGSAPPPRPQARPIQRAPMGAKALARPASSSPPPPPTEPPTPPGDAAVQAAADPGAPGPPADDVANLVPQAPAAALEPAAVAAPLDAPPTGPEDGPERG